MGINYEVATLFAKTFSRLKCNGKLLQLGRQTVELTDEQFLSVLKGGGFASVDNGRITLKNDISGYIKSNTYYMASLGVQNINDKAFFHAIGVDAYSSDASAYEHADYIIDLNKDEPCQVTEKFDIIYNGGTIEHVFNPLNAIATAHRLLKTGGLIIHLVPINGFVDHGYYQFSPCLLQEYYHENGYDILESKYLFVHDGSWYVFEKISAIPFHLFSGALLYFVARKKKAWHSHVIPTQHLYKSLWGAEAVQKDEMLSDYRQRVLFASMTSDPLASGIKRGIAVWCGGDFTKRVLSNFPELAKHILFIVDKDNNKHGCDIAGIKIVAPQYCMDNINAIDKVLISTPTGMPIYNDLSRIDGFRDKLILL